MILGVYAVAAVMWLVAVLRGPMPPWATGVDGRRPVGGHAVPGVRRATAALLPVFFLLPTVSGVRGPARPYGDLRDPSRRSGYLAVWIFYSKRDDRIGLPEHRVPRIPRLPGCGWPSRRRRCASCLARRVVARQGITGSTPPAGFRGRCRPTSDATAKWPSTCMTARCRRCSPRAWNSTRPASGNPDPALDMVYEALQETADPPARLHRHRAAPAGPARRVGLLALREMLKQFEARTQIAVDADLEEVGKPSSPAAVAPGRARTA